MSELILTGLDGANPLGFLAAIGVVEALEAQGFAARLAWEDRGVWQPTLRGVRDADELIEVLDEDRLSCASDSMLLFEYDGTYDLKPPPGVFRAKLKTLTRDARRDARRAVDWAAAFATDIAVDNNGNTKPTALHFTAGQQTFLQVAREVQAGVTPEDLREALFGPWRRERGLKMFGWDATGSRDYALRATNPSTDKKKGVPGADWLALRGLVAIPVVPRGLRIVTTGCRGEWKSERFRWPLWRAWLSRDVIRTVMRMPGLNRISSVERTARGIAAIFECGIRRSDQGGYGSFSPAAVI